MMCRGSVPAQVVRMSSFEKLLTCVGWAFMFAVAGLAAGSAVGGAVADSHIRDAPPGAGHGPAYVAAGEMVGSGLVGLCAGAVVGTAVGAWCASRPPTPGPGTG